MADKVFFNKDIQIIRQSQIKLAYDFLKDHNIVPTVKELQRVTDVFTECCLYAPDDELNGRIDAMDEWLRKKEHKKING